jgi:predicted secreted protein
MNFATALIVFILVWWLVLFTVLPWGIRREENPEEGHEPGAPANPRLWLRLGATTLVAGVIWGIIYWTIASDLIHFGPR